MNINYDLVLKKEYKNRLECALHLHDNGLVLIPALKIGSEWKPIHTLDSWLNGYCREKLIKYSKPNAHYNFMILAKESNLCVIDVDIDERNPEKDGYESLRRLEQEIGPLPETLTISTPRGGKHYWFWDKENRASNKSDAFGKEYKDVDTRGTGRGKHGGVIVAPLSQVVDPYNPTNTKIYSISSFTNIVDIPTSFLDKMQEQNRVESSTIQVYEDDHEEIEEGRRNKHLTLLATKLRQLGLTEEAIYNNLKYENETRVCPPVYDCELRRISSWASQIQPIDAQQDLRRLDAITAFKEFKKENESLKVPEIEPPRNYRFANISRGSKLERHNIEPIDWIIKDMLIRRKITATSSRGGLGKSIESLQLAVAAVSGIPITGHEITKKANVWYHNSEDERMDVRRRLSAIYQHYSILEKNMNGLIYTGKEDHFIIAEVDRYGIYNEIDPTINDIKRCIEDNEIDIFVLDPFIKIAHVPENDNKIRDQLMITLGKIAMECNCAISIVAHTTKEAHHAKGSYGAMRGAGSQEDAIRLLRHIQELSESDINLLFDLEGNKITEERAKSIIKVNTYKNNFGKPSANLIYYEKMSVVCQHKEVEEIGVMERIYLSKDNVQKVTKQETSSFIERRKELVNKIYKFFMQQARVELSINVLSKFLVHNDLYQKVMGEKYSISDSTMRKRKIQDLFKNPDNDYENEGIFKLRVHKCLKPTFICLHIQVVNGRVQSKIFLQKETNQDLLE
jgi:RecA-family ATPase